jgi:hypothetical protein
MRRIATSLLWLSALSDSFFRHDRAVNSGGLQGAEQQGSPARRNELDVE